jgi:hypothetical protein
MEYRYKMIAKNEESPVERPLTDLATEAAGILLQLGDVPQIFFIKEDPNGYIKYPSRINGYCSSDGKYICIRHGLAPKSLVETTVHEARHSFQAHNPKLRMCDDKARERDPELFVQEFFGSHSNSGDAETLTRTLNQILQEESEKVWKKACASGRARLSRPAETESSDDLRRRFAPIIKARSLAVQQFVDPNSSRRLFPDNIEFSYPGAALKLSYQK